MPNKSLAKPASDTCVLVTGGAGYIGSHTCVELLLKGYRVVVIDDLSNSSEAALSRVREITHCKEGQLTFYQGNILDRELLDRIFDQHPIDVVIHFAGYKAVGESVSKPLEYYWNNIAGTLVLCDVARSHGVKNLVFSSSATVYGTPQSVPIDEDCPKGTPTNPYGHTKSMIEQILSDLYEGDPEWDIVLLRYFNPIGAHESGLIGEDPQGIPNNLVPYIAQVAVGKREYVRVFGDDYPTPDGTGVRDYIHVVDLARGHAKALEWMGGDGPRQGVGIFNLGTGKGSSVLEVIKAYEQACGKTLPYKVLPRRPGDIAATYASCEKARRELGWSADYDLLRMCQDSWRWQSNNPDGYGDGISG